MRKAYASGASLLLLLAACSEPAGITSADARPELASPDAPAAPIDAGTPDLADAAIPDAPTFDAPVPDAPAPDAPAPDAAAPDAPLGCVTAAPTAVVMPLTSEPILPGATASFDVAVTDHDSAGCPATTFELRTRSVAQGLTSNPLPGLVLASPPVRGGETTHLTMTAVTSELLDGDRGLISFDVSVAESLQPFFSSVVEVVVGSPSECHVSIPRELMITSVSVVDDPVRTGFTGAPGDPRTGAWTFKRLVEAMAPTADQAPAMVEAMLASFTTAQTINGFQVPARPGMRTMILDAWPRTPSGALDLAAAPFRLLAIVNRFDLRNLARGDAGEGRFVFGFTSGVLPFEATIIFEYKLPAASEADVLEWAQRFHALGALPFSEEYNVALQAITDRFTRRGGRPGRVNGSAIDAVRTNEIAFGDCWELREFVLSPLTGTLVPRPLELTPDLAFDDTDALARFINANAAAIIAETHTVPDLFEGNPFRAGAVMNQGFSWTAPGILDNEARHHFSLNTCNGCHSKDTGVTFLQIHPRLPGNRALLSRFLTGSTVHDPITGAERTFNDLERRQADLAAVVCPLPGAKPSAANLRTGISRVH